MMQSGDFMSNSRLKDLRMYEAVSQQKIADMIQCHLHTYRDYENKSWDSMPLSKALILAKFYNVSVGYLFCLTDVSEKYAIQQNEITKRIRYLRKKNGLNQDEMAAKLFCSTLTYKRYESDAHDIPMGTVVSLARIYHITPDLLIGEGNILEAQLPPMR